MHTKPEMRKHLFLDLEETLITDWYNPALGQRDLVNALLEKHFATGAMGTRGVLDATIWSHAVSDTRDVERFNQYMKDWLERAYAINIIRVITMDEMCECTKAWTGFDRVPPYELIQTYKKDISLEHWVRTHIQKDAHVILLDDTVENKEVFWSDHNLRLTFVRV